MQVVSVYQNNLVLNYNLNESLLLKVLNFRILLLLPHKVVIHTCAFTYIVGTDNIVIVYTFNKTTKFKKFLYLVMFSNDHQ